MTTISNDRIQKKRRRLVPADWVPGPRQGSWTYEAYAALPEDGNRYEIVEGVLMMAPAPEMAHQGIGGKIYRYLCAQILDTERGLVLYAPLDVKLSESTTVQPDVVVLLKEHLDRGQEKHIVGAPDLVVEIISPKSVTYDRLVKYGLYERAGVPEYWLVNAKKRAIEVFVLEEGKYRSLGLLEGEQQLVSRLIPEAEVAVSRFFDWATGLS